MGEELAEQGGSCVLGQSGLQDVEGGALPCASQAPDARSRQDSLRLCVRGGIDFRVLSVR